MTSKIIWFLSIVTFIPKVWAQGIPNQENPNIRDACRSAVAGLYLEVFDERQQSQHNQQNIKVKLGKLRDELKKSLTEWETAKKQLDTADYNPQKTRREIQLRDRVNLLKSTIFQQEGVEKKVDRHLVILTKQEASLRSRIEKVFVIKKKPLVVEEAYQTHIDYRAKCPKYRFICPLPEGQPKELRDIFNNRPLPQACERYSQVLE